MSEDWSKPRDIDPLADGRVSIDFAIAIVDFPRLRPHLAGGGGRAAGRIRFDRERGVAVADVEISARAELICQRCLGPLAWSVQSGGRVALVADGAEADRAPQELEAVLAPDHRLSVRDLAEEELLLALPIVPLHETRGCSAPGNTLNAGAGAMGAAGSVGSGGSAGGGSASAERESPRDERAGEARHRPFERLDELFKRRS